MFKCLTLTHLQQPWIRLIFRKEEWTEGQRGSELVPRHPARKQPGFSPWWSGCGPALGTPALQSHRWPLFCSQDEI